MSSTIKILIIGAGQIGSRHLQGVLKSTHKLSITIVDPLSVSLKLSKVRAEEIILGNPNSTIEYLRELPKNKSFEICVISTNANVRAKVTKDLLVDCQIKHIIFEKILFQKESDFKIISKAIKEKNITSWVNCPRRTFLFYKEIKKTIDKKEAIEMNVNGSSWGMACNSIHFVDLFSYLVNSSDLQILKTNFSNNILKSKRGGNFYEINGLIVLKIGIHYLKISCEDTKKISLHVRIKNKQNEYSINEIEGIWQSNINGLNKTTYQNMPNISDLSGKLIDNLINKNECELVLYEESCKHHLPLLSTIRTHLSKILKKKLIECPIT